MKRDRWLRDFLFMQQQHLEDFIIKLQEFNDNKQSTQKQYKKEKHSDIVNKLANMTHQEIK